MKTILLILALLALSACQQSADPLSAAPSAGTPPESSPPTISLKVRGPEAFPDSYVASTPQVSNGHTFLEVTEMDFTGPDGALTVCLVASGDVMAFQILPTIDGVQHKASGDFLVSECQTAPPTLTILGYGIAWAD